MELPPLVVVGLSGKIGSGKTEVARYIADKYGFIAERIAMDIKLAVAKMTGTSLEDNMTKKHLVARAEYEDGEVWVQSLGKHQVMYGQKQRAEHGDDVFVRRLWARIEGLGDVAGVVVDDVRLRCEADFLAARGAALIRLERPEADRRPFMGGRDPHDVTEVDLDEYEFAHVIENDVPDLGLFARVDEIMGTILH